jgi:hypothetical protein
MSQLTEACNNILGQLSDVVNQLTENEFISPSMTLSESSVGQHLRHTLEFFICLEKGCDIGLINYDKRDHDKVIENDKKIALLTIGRIQQFITRQSANKPLLLEVGYDLANDESVSVQTNYFRELTYNIEHAVHHMAIIKIGIREVAPHVLIPGNFGVAASTLRYRSEIMAGAH